MNCGWVCKCALESERSSGKEGGESNQSGETINIGGASEARHVHLGASVVPKKIFNEKGHRMVPQIGGYVPHFQPPLDVLVCGLGRADRPDYFK